MSHESRCPFRNAKKVSALVQKRNHKRRRRPLPISLHGTGPRLANDFVFTLTESGSPVRPNEEAQQKIFNKAKNIREILGELVEPDSSLRNGDDDGESERSLEEANEEEVGEALALLLNDFLKVMGSYKVDLLLFLIQHPSYNPESIMKRFTSSSTIKGYVKEKLKNREKHFESMGFRQFFVTSESGARCEVYLRDSVTVLTRQCEKSGRDNMFYDFFVERNRKGERIYNHPLSGKLAETGFPEVKAAIKRSSKKDVCWNESRNDFIGAVQLYSDKSSTALSTNALTFYPLHLTLLNFSHELRHSFIQSGATKVAFLPVYLTDSTNDAIRDRSTRMQLLHKALEKILEPLFKASWSSFEYKDKEQIFRRCYPILGNYVTDYPEGKDITSTLGGSGTANPCTRCLVSKDDLGLCTPISVQKRTVLGTLGVQERARDFISRANKCGDRDDARNYRVNSDYMLKRISISRQVPALTQWPFLTLHETLDMYTAMTFEPMHNLALGVGKLLKGCPPLRLGSEDLYSMEFRTSKGDPKQFSKIKVKVLSSVNSALKLIQEECAGSRFYVDFSNSKSNSRLNGFYTSDGIAGMLEAADFMCLDQVFPFVGALIDRMCGEVEEAPTTHVMTLYSDLLECIYRRRQDPGHSKEDLEVLRSKIREFKNFSRALYGAFQVSGMAVPKFHMLDHLPDDIERIGSILSMSAGVFESAHKEFKHEYKSTSRRRRAAMEETITGISEKQSLCRVLENPEKMIFLGWLRA